MTSPTVSMFVFSLLLSLTFDSGPIDEPLLIYAVIIGLIQPLTCWFQAWPLILTNFWVVVE